MKNRISPNKCIIENCDHVRHSHGYCSTHSRRLAKTGSLGSAEARKTIKVCSVETCTEKHDSHGYCGNHARQFRRWGRIRSKEELAQEIGERNRVVKPNLGKTWSELAKKEQSERFKGRTLNAGRTHIKKGQESWNKGKSKYTEEDKKYNRAQRWRFRSVRQKVIERDSSICQICDSYTSNPHVDHIERWSENIELRFEIDNCRTVCMPCHYYITYKRKLPKGLYWGTRRTTT